MKKVKSIINRKKFDLLLNRKNLTYRELASEIYVNRHYISKLATQDRYVSERMRKILLDYLGVEYNDVFDTVELNYVNSHKKIPELTISKDEAKELLAKGKKKVIFREKILELTVVDCE
ncbi:helix-turn-helix domain-containing protein [Staphylococcus epidermidis]|uniref:helix-turn-helix domain-containing protein n=1 Tax=Staphylococcus epidermidis TaxID=1282 RepID=UPI00026BFA53|nr:helix-turn-helix domain-containing protein [Staphylococcus epidermidis]EJE24518.1 hypothetical protein HMPREF9975_05981 [Staphylococcus epidermidis NIHLM001]MCG2451882.1 helix-turn-helix domain-containing protein [Staphylococcus epidermidis]MCO6259295.1 helix-turn-helix domain-containing protein [Staphylococcus epidermidis]NJI76872.1 XRE family transcriptional regulator [Staphylococcus epidermidis]